MTETTIIIILSAATMLALAIFMAWVLGWANVKFHVAQDPKVVAANSVLPGANCGGCGYVGCNDYAEAVVAGDSPPNKCPVGGDDCTNALADILGIEVEQSWPFRPVIHCNASYDERLGRSEYIGEKTCASANLVAGVQGCTYGCMGFGDCSTICTFDAIDIINGLAVVNHERCTGCGACAKVCPRNIITMVPFKSERMIVIRCSNQDFGKDVKAVCKVGCIGCKACQKHSELVTVEDNIPRIDYEKYDPGKIADALHVALEKCPTKRFVEAGRPVETEDTNAKVGGVIRADFKTTVDDTEWLG